jgi:exosome complex component CSL4
MTAELTLPGDRIAAAEEFMAGPGTYECAGVVYAAIAGTVRFSEPDKTVTVLGARRVSALRVGDLVLGEVTGVSNSLANISVNAVEGLDRPIGAGETGAVHVSKMSESYVDDARKEFRAGDLVRAMVVQVSPSLQLSTREPNLGVLKARCGKCRNRLTNLSGKLYCAECERQEYRKLADDFARFTPEYREE